MSTEQQEHQIKAAFFQAFGPSAERDWHGEAGSWFIEGYRAALAAQPQAAQAVPDGWKLVPVEPTPAMVTEGTAHTIRADEEEDGDEYRARGCAISVYKDMLAAAPSASAQPAAPACKGDPGECEHNGACMYACGRSEPTAQDDTHAFKNFHQALAAQKGG